MTKNLVERNRFADMLVRRKLADIGRRYGTIDNAGEKWLPYHNATHSRFVHDDTFRSAQKLAAAGIIDPADVPLARISAIYHDDEQDAGPGLNERLSANAAITALTERPDIFDSTDNEKIDVMILGTVTTVRNGKLVQAADKNNPLAASLADGDLSSLSHITGMRQSLHLLVEMEAAAGRLELPKDAEGLRYLQIPSETLTSHLINHRSFLTQHEYMLDFNKSQKAGQLQENLRLTDLALQAVTDGAQFGQLLDGAVTYARDLGRISGRDMGMGAA